MSSEILYPTGLPVLDVPPLIHRDLGAHLGSVSIVAVDYLAGAESCSAFTTFTGSANVHRLIAVPFVSPSFPCSVNQIQFEVTTSQAGTEAFIGLFENADIQAPLLLGDVFSPGKMLFSSGSVATASNGLKASAISPAVVLKPNRMYWLCIAFTAAATLPSVRAISSSSAAWLGLQVDGTLLSAMFQSSSVAPVAWGDASNIPGSAWSALSVIPALRYRLTA